MKTKEEILFREAPVGRAVLTLIIPTIIGQLITVIYNMADTFFIGQIGDPNQVAAVSLCMPMFVFLTGLANLFGIGGSSLMARSLGAGEHRRAKQAAAFCIWTAFAISLIYGIGLYAVRALVLPAVGANAETYGFCCQYIFWTITIGAVPTVLNQALANLVRAEGHSAQASFGVALGGVLNIFLDPVFIFLFRLEIAGAAIATMVSNVIATLYFILLIAKKRGESDICFDPRLYTWSRRIPREVLLVGLPSCLMNLMGVLSNITINKLMSGYSNAAVAGIGVAKKIDMLSFAIATGMSQGVLPLIGYNYSAKNYKRMKAALRVDFLIGLGVALVSTFFLFTCAGPIVRVFIDDAETVRYGQLFQRIICITGPCISVTMLAITSFQSVGKKVQPTILSLLRKGGLDIPFMFLLNHLAGADGIVWATPIADLGAMTVAILLFIPFWRRLSEKNQTSIG
ncbi:MAG TPA: MATE family efflux transporter [Candidatus Pygmaiobacter gallistercoris]|nr:MATE family efflux transporter [Candidatus Pygmaiobacter gallistercoris]